MDAKKHSQTYSLLDSTTIINPLYNVRKREVDYQTTSLFRLHHTYLFTGIIR